VAGKLTTLHSFEGTDGGGPYFGPLFQGTNGDLYGTTYVGGANQSYPFALGGTAFKITPSGKLTTLYSFCEESGCLDGLSPFGGLIQAANGKLYGTTIWGGAYGENECIPYGSSYGCGTLFSITAGQ
jgi:uncharacterized repeat protein (TIGR03803 family)